MMEGDYGSLYTQEMRANHEPCPLCGVWHSALSCPPQNLERSDIAQLEREKIYLANRLIEIEKECDCLRKIVKDNARDVLIKELHFEKGVMDLAMEHPIFYLFVISIGDMFLRTGAKNYIEICLSSHPIGNFTVTVQKESGKTPHQLRQEAEAHVKELEAQLSAANHALAMTTPWVSTDHHGVCFCMHCFSTVPDHTPNCVWVQENNFVEQEEKDRNAK